jgi:hypothetical protein
MEGIQRQRRQFVASKTAELSSYLEAKKRSSTGSELIVLNGWGEIDNRSRIVPYILKRSVKTICRSGGYWVRTGGIGVVVNPGQDFLSRFHKAGLHIWDVDHVIVTDEEEGSLESVWAFNKEVNSMLQQWNLSPHIISYWLHPHSYEKHARNMRPTCRAEQGSLHQLEVFCEDDHFESVCLTENVQLDFCRTNPSLGVSSPLQIRLRASDSIGFLLGGRAKQESHEFLSSCNALVVGIGDVLLEDVSGISQTEGMLGYQGVLSLLQSSSAKICIVSEFGFTEGDLRTEVIKQLRHDLSDRETVILPGEDGVEIFIENLSVRAPGLETLTRAQEVKTFRKSGMYSELVFADTSAVL